MDRHKPLFSASYRAGTVMWSHGAVAGTQTTIERHGICISKAGLKIVKNVICPVQAHL
jgi:hypothetical protein